MLLCSYLVMYYVVMYYVVMQLCGGKELQPFPSLPSLFFYPPTFHRFSTFPFPAFPFPIYPTFLLPSPSTSLPCSFRCSLYSLFPLNLPQSLGTFPFPSQPSPSLLFLFPTYLFPNLSPLLPIHIPPFPLPTFPILPFFSLLPFPFSFTFIFPFSFHFPPFTFPFSFSFSFSFTSHSLGSLIFSSPPPRGEKDFYTPC